MIFANFLLNNSIEKFTFVSEHIVTDRMDIIDNLDDVRKRFEKFYTKTAKDAREIVAANIIYAREFVFFDTPMHKKVTQQLRYIAAISGVHEQTIRRLERGSENITIDSIARICSVFKIELGYMFIDGGAKLFLDEMMKEKIIPTSLKKKVFTSDHKEVIFYWDGDVPTMRKTDGSIRQFDLDDCVVWKKHVGSEFIVSFIKDGKHKCIMHHHLYQPNFRVIGVQYHEQMKSDWIIFDRVCSSVLFVSWNRSVAPQYDVIKSRIYRDLSYYTDAAY